MTYYCVSDILLALYVKTVRYGSAFFQMLGSNGVLSQKEKKKFQQKIRVLAQKKKKKKRKRWLKKNFLRFARRDYAAPPKIKKVRMDFQHVQF